ncbi:MAG: hypothetical protein ABIJ34_05060 [archaeon]
MKNWKATTFVAISAMAALTTILSLPGAILAGLTGIAIFSGIGNVFMIGIMYPLIPLLFKRVGALTLWSVISGILAIPFPIMGPPGLFIKVIYSALWGILGDITYFVFKKSEKLSAIAIATIQLAPGVPIAVFFWSILGLPEIAAQYSNFGNLSWFFIVSGIIFGALLGYLSYLIYKKIEKTTIVRRIQK